LLGRVRVALGGRDHRAEVAGYLLALRGASEEQAGIIAEQLMDLAESPAWDAALAGLAGVFERLEPAKRERVLVTGHGRWGKVCLGVALSPDPGERRSVALLIARACDPEAMPLLADLLRDREPLVAEAAGDGIETLAARAARPPSLDAATRRAIERVVISAAERFEQHRRREALVALVTLIDSPAALRGAGPALRALLDDAEHPVHMGLRSIFKRADGVAPRRSAWVWLAQEGVRSACLERLGQGGDALEHQSVLERGHLAHNPLRRAALAAGVLGKRGPTMEVPAEVVETAPVGALGQLGTVLGAARASEERVEAALEPLLGRDEPLAGLAALRAEDALGTHALTLDLCFAGSPRVARAAAARAAALAGRGAIDRGAAGRALAALARAEDPGVRGAGEIAAARLDVLALGAGAVAARELLAADRDALVRSLQAAVRSGDLRRRLSAMRVAARLGLGASIELELLAIVGQSAEAAASKDAGAVEIVKAAASAVGVLVELASPAAQHAVSRCLHHPDMRVRANAMDALARVGRRRGWLGTASSPVAKAVVEFKAHDHHRVRSSAVRAELISGLAGDGATVLSTGVVPMLTDGRPMHRVAGLWLAERAAVRLGLGAADALAGIVADLVRRDPDGMVKVRAKRCAAQLLGGMRARWAGRVGV
jgi:hypothetical protein